MRVLVADDDSSTRHLLWRLLTDWGHNVVSVGDADEAWSVLQQSSPPHLAIIDRGLAKGGGLGLCRLVRDFNLRAQMYIIVSTSVVDNPALVTGFEAGADDLIAKPFDIEDLHRRVTDGCREVAVRLLASGVEVDATERAAPHRLPLPSFVSVQAPTLVRPPFDERPLLALGRLGQRALEGTRLADFSRAVARELLDTLDAASVRVAGPSASGEQVVHAQLGEAIASPPPDGRLYSVPFGPPGRQQGTVLVVFAHPRQPTTTDRELLSSVGHLLGLVAERERLEQQVRRAQRLEIFGHLAGGVAHDFNNVLAVVSTSAETLETVAPNNPDVSSELALVQRAVARGRMLSSRLLGFDRPPSADPNAIDLNETIFQARGMLERMMQGRVTVSTDLDPRSLLIRAERTEVEQVLMNLLLNARDACDGGATVHIQTGHGPTGQGAPGLVSFSITDQGAGMCEETRRHMFEPYFTTKPPGEGIGLGLSSVKEIVRRAGGKIDVESAVGRGTTVTVHWPCAASNCCAQNEISGAA